MSNLGFHSLFHRVASFHGIRAVRFFLEKNGELLCPDTAYPRYGGHSGLAGCDAIFFSVSFELDYLNIIRMLAASSIPPLSRERKNSYPLIVTGGITVTANPEILSCFADVIYIGDMECSLNSMLETLLSGSFRKSSRLLLQLSQLDGVYVPVIDEPAQPADCSHSESPGWFSSGQGSAGVGIPGRVFLKEIVHPSHSVVLSNRTEFANMFLVEIGRGCRNRCKFCLARCITSPLRSVGADKVIEAVQRAVPFAHRVGLIAPVLTDHRDLYSIVRKINEMGLFVSFPSLRADDFDEELAGLLSQNRQKSITFAPETGSVELRKKMGKSLTNEALFRAVRIALSFGITRFRYYLMYGLPGERMDDIRAIGALVRETAALLRENGAELHLSINPFVPKRGTALEKHPLYPPDYYEKMKSHLKEEFRGLRRVTFRFDSLRWLRRQYYLSAGNSEIGELLYRCFRNGSMRGFAKSAEVIMEQRSGGE